jgi:hypothetical protein
MSDFRQMEAVSREIGNRIGKIIEKYSDTTGRKWGFALMIFSFDGEEFTWISNAERADMVKAMQEFINRNPPDITSEQMS